MVEQRNDEAEPAEEPTATELLQEIVVSQRPDWWLAFWVDIVNRSEDVSMGMTLMVHGTIVSGDLVSGRVYFEGLANHVRSTGTGGGVDAYVAALEQGAGAYPVKKLRHESEDPDDDKSDPTYIHLRDARVISSSVGAPMQGIKVWWRGRLSTIDAFWIGAIQESSVG